MAQSDKGLVNVTGLYESTSKAGQRYLSGRLGLAKVFIFKVKAPKKDGPTYMLAMGEWQQAEGGSRRDRDDEPVPF